MTRLPSRLTAPVLLGAFFLSGASALAYEILWTRVIAATFGVTAHAIATVLSAFMAGMALGSHLGGRLAARLATGHGPNPIVGYALIEGAIALTAIAVQALLSHAGPLLVWVADALPGATPLQLAGRFVCLALLLLPPTLLMGATFPLFVQGFAPYARTAHEGITRAYGVNVLGAATGCYLAAYVLLEGLGVTRSIALVAATNVLAAAMVLMARGGAGTAPDSPSEEPDFPLDSRLLLGLVGLSGLTGIAFEVVWSRVYRQALMLPNPFKGFAMVLTTILVGMAAGSLLLSLARPTARAALKLYGGLQACLAVLSLLGIAQLRVALGTAVSPEHGAAQRALLTITLLLPAMLAGASFPTLGSAWARAPASLGARVGALSFVSTAGGVLGSLLGGFVLLPSLGSRYALLLLALLTASAGWLAVRYGVHRGDPDGAGARRSDALGFSLLVLVLWVGKVTADKPDFPLPANTEFVWRQDGLEATAIVAYDRVKRSNVLYTNGIRIEPQSQAHRVALPMILAPRAHAILLVGFGTGASAKHLLDNFPESRVDCVELDGNQPGAARYFGTEAVLTDPRFSLTIDDGRQFLLRNPGRWDTIIVDTFGQDVNQEFYSVEFFRAALAALAPDGTFFIKFPVTSLYDTTDADVLLRSAASTFPHSWVVLINPEQGNGLVGRRDPLTVSETRFSSMPAAIRNLFPFADIQRRFRELDPATIARLPGDRLNTDDRPYFFDRHGAQADDLAVWRYLGELTSRQ